MKILLAVLLALGACWPTVGGLHDVWTDWDLTTYAHGYLVVATSVLLLFRDSSPPLPADRRGNAACMLALPLVVLAWTIGARGGLASVEWLLLPIVIGLAVRLALGARLGTRRIFAIGFLYFAMPLWGTVNPVLQWGTVHVVRSALQLIGLPAHFEGNLVHIPAGTFEIEGGCSGLHFVMVALALGALMGELRRDDWRGRLKLLLLAGTLALVANWVRVFTVILAGHYTHMQHYLVARSHYGYGWVLFALAMVAFFLYEWRQAPSRAAAGPPAGGLAGDARARGSLPLVALTLATTTALLWLSGRPADVSTRLASPEVPGWFSSQEDAGKWAAGHGGADGVSIRGYTSEAGERIDRGAFLYLGQQQGREIGIQWLHESEEERVQEVRQARLGGLPVTLLELRDARGERWLVAASFSSARRDYAAAVPAQLRYALDSLLRLRSVPSGLRLWRTRCIHECEAAERLLDRFVAMSEAQGTFL